MAINDWDDEYESLLQNIKSDEDVDSAIKNKRKEPRFLVDRVLVNALHVYEFEAIDISAEGIAFRSEISFRIGSRLHLTFQQIISIEVDVVNRNMFESDADFMEYQYRIGSQYVDSSQGKHLIVLMYRLDNLKLPT